MRKLVVAVLVVAVVASPFSSSGARGQAAVADGQSQGPAGGDRHRGLLAELRSQAVPSMHDAARTLARRSLVELVNDVGPVQSRAGAPVLPPLPTDSPEGTPSPGLPISAGDFDGDGGGDVLQSFFGEGSTVHKARRGSTGEVLWSVTSPSNIAGVVPARFDGERGGLVIWYSGNFIDRQGVTSAQDVTLHIDARGHDGRLLWQREWTGSFLFAGLAGTASGFPAVWGLFDAVGSEATDVLLVRETVTFTPVHENSTVVVEVIDGDDGEAAMHLERASEDDEYMPWAAPDLTGDQKDDLFLESQQELQAVSGIDGAMLWSAPGKLAPEPTGDTNGDGTSDFQVQANEPGSVPGTGTFVCQLIDGRTGSLLLSDERCFISAGDIDGDGRVELVSWSSRRIDDIHAAVDVRVFRSDGSTAVAHTFEFELPPNTHMSSDMGNDADGDGVRDLRVEFRSNLDSYDATAEFHSVRTGAFISRGLGGVPMGLSIDGNGDDVVHFTNMVTGIVDGLTGGNLWMIPTPDDNSRLVMAQDDVDGDGSREVSYMGVNTETGATRVLLLSGADGHTMWAETAG